MPSFGSYPAVTAPASTDLFLVKQGAATKGMTLAQVQGGLATSGALWAIASLTETTIIANGLPVQQTAIQIPAGAVALAACTRVTVQPGGTTLMTVRGAGSGHQFNLTDVSTVANSVDPGTNGCPVFMAAAEPISYTFDADTTDGLGRIQTTIFYYTVTP